MPKIDWAVKEDYPSCEPGSYLTTADSETHDGSLGSFWPSELGRYSCSRVEGSNGCSSVKAAPRTSLNVGHLT